MYGLDADRLTLPRLVEHAERYRAPVTLTATVRGREGGLTPSMLLVLANATGREAITKALRDAADSLDPAPATMGLVVPEYAHTLVERLEQVRASLDGRALAPVRRGALEAEASNLGAALGSMLARTLLEQRSAD